MNNVAKKTTVTGTDTGKSLKSVRAHHISRSLRDISATASTAPPADNATPNTNLAAVPSHRR